LNATGESRPLGLNVPGVNGEQKQMSKSKETPVSLPRLLTIKQVAEYSQFSTRQIRRWIKSGKLKASQLGRSWRIAENDLAMFLAAFRRL
jgi:excisionase family DNA binding protein